jgi:endonuclease/exonuclease/phosphatase family metal-dependent hydrolase
MADGSLVVLTQNAWGGAPLWRQRSARLAQAMAARSPDIVGLQEVHAETPSGEGSQAHELAGQMDGYDALFAPGRVTPSRHAEGVALLVKRRHTIVDRSALALSRDPNDPLDGGHQRIVLRASVRVGDVVLDAFVTHASLSRRARERTLPELAGFARSERARTGSAGAVLMGDFNATPGEPALVALADAGWTDAWAHVHEGERGGTWPAGAPFRRIDYVWVQPGAGISIQACERTSVAGSDHVGLLVTLRMG